MGIVGKVIPIIALDKYYVPEKHIDQDKLEELYHIQLFNDQMCRKCELKDDRPCDTCYECEGMVANYTLWSDKDFDGKPYVGIPLGNRKKVRQLLDGKKLKIIDRRSDGHKPLHKRIKFNTKILYPYQVEGVNEAYEAGYGILEAPPRSGKTAMGTALAVKHGMRTLFLVHQEDLAKQFIETWRSTKPKFTNIPALEEELGRPLVGMARKLEDFQKLHFAAATYQTFLSKSGRKLLRKIRRMFGVVIVDEVHRSSAAGYAKVVNQLECRHRYGLTGTVERKDGRHVVGRHTIGPVVYKASVDTLPPTVDIIESALHINKNYALWTYAMRAIEKDKDRTKLIVRLAVKAIQDGRSVLIPVTFTKQATTIRDLINRKLGKTLASEFVGRNKSQKPLKPGKVATNRREEIVLWARSGKIKCVVAQRSLLTGVNVPRWDYLLEAMPMNNPPNFRQEYNRVCTPMEGKPSPIVQFIIDDFAPSRSCVLNMSKLLREDINKERIQEKQRPLVFTKRFEELYTKHMRIRGAKYAARARQGGDYSHTDDSPKVHKSSYD